MIERLIIKETMKRYGTSVNEVADKMGITRFTLSTHINGNPSTEILLRIADAIGCPVSALFEAERDFIAFVRRNGETFTFESEGALKAYAETLPASTDK